MRRLWSLLAVAVLAGVGGCGGAAAADETDQYTQGGVSMEPTVKAGQVITVRAIKGEYKPQRGDIVLFHPAGEQWGDSKAPFLKRVIAVGGETVACCDMAGRVTVDGKPQAEPYVANNAPLNVPSSPHQCGSRKFDSVVVPADTIFVMGDNRALSNDSRCAGSIPAKSVFAVMTS